jgi:hypothetical protein
VSRVEATCGEASLNKATDTQIEAGKLSLKNSEVLNLHLNWKHRPGSNSSTTIGGLGGLDASLTTGSATDIKLASAKISGTFDAQQKKQKDRDKNRDTSEFEGKKGFANDKRPEARAANEALITFTRQRVALLKEELSLVKAKNAAEKKSIESLLTGDIQGFIDGQITAGAAAALRSGSSGLVGTQGLNWVQGLRVLKDRDYLME